jgi:uncharacterized protein with HEPN domain
MSHRDWQLLVGDILDAIERIEQYTAGMIFEAFEDDERTIDAVIRNFITIGEAAAHVSAEKAAQYPDIPWRLMSDMRNFAVHHYWAVEPIILWQTIKNDLPDLAVKLRSISGDTDASQ